MKKYLLLTLLISTSAQAEKLSFTEAIQITRGGNPKCLQADDGSLIRELETKLPGEGSANPLSWSVCLSSAGWVIGPSIDARINRMISDSKIKWEVTNCRCQHD